MKRVKSPGHSARHGNMPSPYHKYEKKPWKYGEAVAAVYRRAGKHIDARREEK